MSRGYRLLNETNEVDFDVGDGGHERSHNEDSHSLEPTRPTQRESATLKRVAGKIPKAAWFIIIVELCERFAYYGIMGPLQNYMQYSPSSSAASSQENQVVSGVLGLGQSGATALSNTFTFWCYLTPILGAIIADQYLGKFRTIRSFAIVYTLGLSVLFLTSFPSFQRLSFWGLVAAMVLMGLGAGGIKSNVSPMAAEQSPEHAYVEVRYGEKVLVDPEMTIQRLFMVFYMAINVGSLSGIVTTTLEHNIGFWSSFLVPLVMFVIGVFVLLAGRPYYKLSKPTGTIIFSACRVFYISARSGFNLDSAKPPNNHSSLPQNSVSNLHTPSNLQQHSWTAAFVDECRQVLHACKVFSFFPIYWIAYGQMTNNLISQAATMATHSVPNDILQNIDPIILILFIPLFDRVIYPALRRSRIKMGVATRITMGFILAALGMLYTALLQSWIYTSPPHSVHIAFQIPSYILIAISEIFASITGLEYAYTHNPPSLKSIVMALFLGTNAAGAVFQIMGAGMFRDPWLVYAYAGVSGLAFIAAIGFWYCFGGMDDDDTTGDDGIMFSLESYQNP